MTDYQEYIGALRKCAKEHENDRTSTGQIIVSNLCEVIADLLEDLSSSGKPNKSIEEKCPCYHCEHFEIKGWSHCKIHEGAYGDSRCNDYHKVNQEPNKSEIPTGSITKNDLGVDCISRADVNRVICEYRDDNAETGSERDLERAYGANAVGALISELPSITPQEPKKGEWLRMSDLSEQEDDRYKCSRCGNVIHHKNEMNLYTFNSWCGRCGSDNGRHINYEVENDKRRRT